LTALEGAPDQVAAVGRRGRARWQSEHEPCTGHTTHGSARAHHDRPGQQTVAVGVSRLKRWACIAQGILERGDRLSQRCRMTTSRRELWHTVRTAMRMMLGTAGADFLLLSLDEAGSSPSAPAVQAGAWQERPVVNPAVGKRAEASARRTNEQRSHAPLFLGSCPRQHLTGVCSYRVGHLGVWG
jgi:hypothetical protein